MISGNPLSTVNTKWLMRYIRRIRLLFLNWMNKIPAIFLNRYVITILSLFLWLLILDETDLFTLHKYRSHLTELKEEKIHLESKVIEVKESLEALSNNPKELERFAREHHYMKRADEDLFVIVEE